MIIIIIIIIANRKYLITVNTYDIRIFVYIVHNLHNYYAPRCVCVLRKLFKIRVITLS